MRQSITKDVQGNKLKTAPQLNATVLRLIKCNTIRVTLVKTLRQNKAHGLIQKVPDTVQYKNNGSNTLWKHIIQCGSLQVEQHTVTAVILSVVIITMYRGDDL